MGKVFGGGQGNPTGNPIPQEGTDLANTLSNAAARTYIIEPAGANIVLRFAVNGLVTVTANDSTFTLPYTMG